METPVGPAKKATKRWRGHLSPARLAIVLVAAFLSQGNGCADLMTPTPPSGAEQCAAVGSLYCNSYEVPQILDGAPGTCCAVGDSPNASVGYLCAYGASRQPAGCLSRLSTAREICPSAPTIVRCTR